MPNRIIQMCVEDAFITNTGETAGAAGSANAVTLRMSFDECWTGTSKTVYFTDANEEKSVSVLLGTADTYDLPVPAEAMTWAGLASVTVTGAELAADGVTIARKITTRAAKFRVMDSEIPESAANTETITATDKEQMQAALDRLLGMSVEANGIPAGTPPTVTKGTDATGNVKLAFAIPQGERGQRGPAGDGSGDMLSAIYDPTGREQDVFGYVDATKVSRTGYGYYTENIDDLRIGGTWLCIGENLSGDVPTTSTWFTMSVFAGGTGSFTQIANTDTDVLRETETYIRHFNGAEWSPWSRLVTASQLPNRNLLDNWDFRNPVNQRGLTSYAGAQYTLDMWYLQHPDARVTLDSANKCIVMSQVASTLVHPFEAVFTEDTVVTLSAIYKGTIGLLYWGDNSILNHVETSDKWAIASRTYVIPAGTAVGTNWAYSPSIANASADYGLQSTKDLYVRAVKLELGSVSTLANDPPADYGAELLKCQRYYWQSDMQFATKDFLNSFILICNAHLPVAMRAVPVITVTSTAGTKNTVSVWASGLDSGLKVTAAYTTKEGINAIYLDSNTPANVNDVYSFRLIANADL